MENLCRHVEVKRIAHTARLNPHMSLKINPSQKFIFESLDRAFLMGVSAHNKEVRNELVKFCTYLQIPRAVRKRTLQKPKLQDYAVIFILKIWRVAVNPNQSY